MTCQFAGSVGGVPASPTTIPPDLIPVRVAPARFACLSCVPCTFALVRYAPLRSAAKRLADGPTRYSFTEIYSVGNAAGTPIVFPIIPPNIDPLRSAPSSFAPVTCVEVKFALVRSVLVRCFRFAFSRYAPVKFTPGPTRNWTDGDPRNGGVVKTFQDGWWQVGVPSADCLASKCQ